jgi:hypothetical protein
MHAGSNVRRCISEMVPDAAEKYFLMYGCQKELL